MGQKVPPPKAPPVEFGQRLSGLGQFPADLSWFRIYVPFWSFRLSLLFQRGRTEVDRAVAAPYIQLGSTPARRPTPWPSIISPLNPEVNLARLKSALLNQNKAELAARFEHVAR